MANIFLMKLVSWNPSKFCSTILLLVLLLLLLLFWHGLPNCQNFQALTCAGKKHVTTAVVDCPGGRSHPSTRKRRNCTRKTKRRNCRTSSSLTEKTPSARASWRAATTDSSKCVCCGLFCFSWCIRPHIHAHNVIRRDQSTRFVLRFQIRRQVTQ